MIKCFVMLTLATIFHVQSKIPITTNLVNEIEVRRSRLIVSVNDTFKRRYLKEDFFVTYHDDINLENLDESILIVPFLLNVISIVWVSGDTYHIPALDYDLYYSLKKVKKVLQAMYPKTDFNGEVIPGRLVKHAFALSTQGTAQMFSYGLDSLCSSLSHKSDPQLLITVHGHADTPLDSQDTWHSLKNRCAAFAKKFGFANSFLSSNYHQLFNYEVLRELSPEIDNWRLGAVEGLGWIGLAVPLLVIKGYSKLRIASSITWDCPWSHAANPFIDNAVICAGISVEHDGFEHTRVQKCELIKKLMHANYIRKLQVRVCSSTKSMVNCGKCASCILTIYGLWAVGEDHHNYGFDINTQDVIKAASKFLQGHRKISRYKVWHFQCVQDYFKQHKERRHGGRSLNAHIERFLAHDFMQNMQVYNNKQYAQVVWKDFLVDR